MILSPIHHRQSDLRKLYLIGGCSYKRFCSNYCSQVTIIQNPTKSKQIRYNVTQTVYKLKPARSFWLFSGLSLFILFLSSQLVTITIKCILSKKPFVKDNQSTQLFLYIYIYIYIYTYIYIYIHIYTYNIYIYIYIYIHLLYVYSVIRIQYVLVYFISYTMTCIIFFSEEKIHFYARSNS